MPLAGDAFSQVKTWSKRLVAAYILDWIAIIGIAAIALGIANISPHYHAFSPIDLSISYPFHPETISSGVLAVIGGVIPAVIIFLVVMIFVPGPTAWRGMSKMALFRWKLWEWNAGWLGLAMTHATSQLMVQGTKNMAGKPRPNMLARCVPDLDRITASMVGGYAVGTDISPGWVLVNETICTSTDVTTLDDGFRSFPSGHAATSWAGMLFLSLFLASKFSIWFPLLPISGTQGDPYHRNRKDTRQIVYRDEGAAPPTWLLFLFVIPIGVAVYVTGTRYFDYYHFGFDMIAGTFIGIISAWFSFRWYNLPLGRSAGWAWGPRSRGRAFAIGVGSHGWVSEEDDQTATAANVKSENGRAVAERPQDVELGNFGHQRAPTSGEALLHGSDRREVSTSDM